MSEPCWPDGDGGGKRCRNVQHVPVLQEHQWDLPALHSGALLQTEQHLRSGKQDIRSTWCASSWNANLRLCLTELWWRCWQEAQIFWSKRAGGSPALITMVWTNSWRRRLFSSVTWFVWSHSESVIFRCLTDEFKIKNENRSEMFHHPSPHQCDWSHWWSCGWRYSKGHEAACSAQNQSINQSCYFVKCNVAHTS